MGITYRDSGVDTEAGQSFVKRIAPIVKATHDAAVLSDIGGFGALYSGQFPGMTEPVLVSGTDGVGTKLKIAQMMGVHNTIGIDAVAMCVNDILVSGARPLFFLDYLACGKLIPDVMVEIVKGLAEGCTQAGCSLVGGETAEHPGVMPDNDYDIGGFAVGVVDRPRIIDGKRIAEGDVIIGCDSSGLHSNGFSLVRKVMFGLKGLTVESRIDELGCTLGEAMLVPTKIYCRQMLDVLAKGRDVRGMVHVTGGGFFENMPRIFPAGLGARVSKASYRVPALFEVIRSCGAIEEREMYATFNMGIGLMIFAPQSEADAIIADLAGHGISSRVIGSMIRSDAKEVIIE